MRTAILQTALMATLALASPILPISSRGAGDSAVSQLLQIAPSSTACDTTQFPECETATQAAPFLISAMADYGIYQPPEIAAVLSLIAFETAEFKYGKNHFPGRPGQGTRNMQMPNFNLEYALSIPALSDKAKAIAPSGTTTGLSDDQLNQILALVLPDQYSWASAAWFLTTKCASARPQLQAGGQAGFDAYMQCVGTTSTDDRLTYWKNANTAFGLS